MPWRKPRLPCLPHSRHLLTSDGKVVTCWLSLPFLPPDETVSTQPGQGWEFHQYLQAPFGEQKYWPYCPQESLPQRPFFVWVVAAEPCGRLWTMRARVFPSFVGSQWFVVIKEVMGTINHFVEEPWLPSQALYFILCPLQASSVLRSPNGEMDFSLVSGAVGVKCRQTLTLCLDQDHTWEVVHLEQKIRIFEGLVPGETPFHFIS